MEVATGETHEVPPGDLATGDLSLEEWSVDGWYLGLVSTPKWEGYWATRARAEVRVVQGLEEAAGSTLFQGAGAAGPLPFTPSSATGTGVAPSRNHHLSHPHSPPVS